MKKFEKLQKGWFAVYVYAKKNSVKNLENVKSAINSVVSRSNLNDVIFDVVISSEKEYNNFLLINMIPTPEAISAILRLNNVMYFLGSNHNPTSLTESEVQSML